jgi:NAD(P)-dependent dehydrogenase (short-subunit alcohol dehydrogenase family)
MGTRRQFLGKTVVVTGAAGGLGRAFCRRFGQGGARLGLLDLESESLRSFSDELENEGVECLAVACDVTQEAECTSAMAAVEKRFGGVDVLINNAGITHRSAFEDTSTDVYRHVMNVNFFGSLYCTKAAIASLIPRKGLIIVVSSIAGFSPLYGRTGYAAGKHALHGLFDSLRTELSGKGVGVLIVCPGFTQTGISKAALNGDGRPTDHPQSTVGRIAQPEEVAEAVFQAAGRDKRLLVLSTVGRLTRFVHKIFPGLYERMMTRSLSSELER